LKKNIEEKRMRWINTGKATGKINIRRKVFKEL
jgi:hypothetical protein